MRKTFVALMALVIAMTFGTVTFVQADENAAAPAPAAPAAAPAAALEEKKDMGEHKGTEKKVEKKTAKKKAKNRPALFGCPPHRLKGLPVFRTLFENQHVSPP